MDLLESAAPKMELPEGTFVRSDQLLGFVDNLKHSVRERDHSILNQARGIRMDRFVDVEEFTKSKEFLGLAGIIRPAIMRALIDVFHSDNYYLEVLGTGGIGIGKGFLAQVGTCYYLYSLGILHNPQLEYNLRPGSSIYFVIQSKTAALAKKAVFDELREMIVASPWFNKYFMFDKTVKAEMRFPGNIFITPFGGQDTDALGLNVCGAVLDEMNFMDVIEDSARTRHTGEREFDQAERVYNSISRRIQARFQTYGKVPGKVFLLSSSHYSGDFTDRKIQEARTDNTIYVMKLAQWESLSEEKFCGDKFLVEVGSEIKQSRILNSIAEAKDEGDVIEVPVEYRRSFEKDINGSLRDFAGVSIGFRHPFIPYYDKIDAMTTGFHELLGGRSLFIKEESSLEDVFNTPDGVPIWENIIDFGYVDDLLDMGEQQFAGHFDVGISGDAGGLSFGHVMGFTRAPPRGSERSQEDHEIKPIYLIDGSLRIIPSSIGEIYLDNVRDLVLYVNNLLGLSWFSCDSFQSVQFLQPIKRAGVSSGTLSVDTSFDPFMEYKSAIFDGRIYAGSGILAVETRELEKTDKKIDHGPSGSKDVADSAAGTVFLLQRKTRQAISRGTRRNRRVQQRLVETGGRERRPARITSGGGRKQGRQVRRIL